jgi:hypothetical protein
MKFGINFFPAFRPNQNTTAEYYAQCLRVSERADELGFNSIKTVEHYFHDYGGHSPNPIVLLAAIAARQVRRAATLLLIRLRSRSLKNHPSNKPADGSGCWRGDPPRSSPSHRPKLHRASLPAGLRVLRV